jgi:hypothetical protein
MSDLSPAEREAMLRVHLTRGKGVYHRERVWLAARDYYAAEHAEDIVSMASARDVGAFKGGQKQSEDRIRVLEARLVSCEPRGECPVCGGERDHMDACEVGALSSRIRVLEEALAFYGAQKGLGSVLASDGGMRARNALKLSTSVGSSGAEANSDEPTFDVETNFAADSSKLGIDPRSDSRAPIAGSTGPRTELSAECARETSHSGEHTGKLDADDEAEHHG